MKRILLMLAISVSSGELLFAQWTKEDSTWLGNVLSGKEELHLNQETLKAIRSGTLLNIGAPATKPFMSPSETPILRDFDLTSTTDSALFMRLPGELDPDAMEPYLYFKYFFMFAKLPPIKEKKVIPGFDLHGVNLRKGALSPTDPRAGVNILNGSQGGSSISAGAVVSGDFQAAITSILSPSYRRRLYNRKNANAWKTYNNSGRIDSLPPLSTTKK
jgi:hypothetical protein